MSTRRCLVLVTVLAAAVLSSLFWRQGLKQDNTAISNRSEPADSEKLLQNAARPTASNEATIPTPAPETKPEIIEAEGIIHEKRISKLLMDLNRITVTDTPRLVKILTVSTNEDEIEYAATGLAKIGNLNAVSNLLSAYESFADLEFRENLAEIICTITNREAVPAIIGALKSTQSAPLIHATTEVLSGIANDRVVSDLADAYKQTDDARVRLRVGIAIGSIHNPDSTSGLVALSEKTDSLLESSLAAFAEDALGRIGTAETAGYLLQKLQVATAEDQSTLIHATALISGQTALPLLQSTAGTNTNTAVRIAAILALGNYDDEANLTLLESLSHPGIPAEELRALEITRSRIRGRAK